MSGLKQILNPMGKDGSGKGFDLRAAFDPGGFFSDNDDYGAFKQPDKTAEQIANEAATKKANLEAGVTDTERRRKRIRQAATKQSPGTILQVEGEGTELKGF